MPTHVRVETGRSRAGAILLVLKKAAETQEQISAKELAARATAEREPDRAAVNKAEVYATIQHLKRSGFEINKPEKGAGRGYLLVNPDHEPAGENARGVTVHAKPLDPEVAIELVCAILVEAKGLMSLDEAYEEFKLKHQEYGNPTHTRDRILTAITRLREAGRAAYIWAEKDKYDGVTRFMARTRVVVENGLEYAVFEVPGGREQWAFEGKTHRVGRPAVTGKDGTEYWCVEDKYYRNKADYLHAIAKWCLKHKDKLRAGRTGNTP